MTDASLARNYPASSQMRTLAVRITDDLRAQLDVIAQLNDRSVTEEIRIALEGRGGSRPASPTPPSSSVLRRFGPISNARRRPSATRSRPSLVAPPRMRGTLRHHWFPWAGQAGNGRTPNATATRDRRALTSSLPGGCRNSPYSRTSLLH